MSTSVPPAPAAYPPQLFDIILRYHLAGSSDARTDLAVDVASGTGQVSLPLVELLGFLSVIGIEPSDAMRAAKSADLVTAGVAAHWFDTPAFFKSAAGVLRPGGRGTPAFWSYPFPRVVGIAEASEVILHGAMRGPLSAFWDPRTDLVQERYMHPSFVPDDGLFKDYTRLELPDAVHPDARMRRTYTLEELGAYIRTWSGSKAYADHRASNPGAAALEPDAVDEMVAEIGRLTGAGAAGSPDPTVTLEWDLVLILARTR
ncbi:hypothetical protein HK405_012745 [Cladochytrium tenue]|nr:hypothetical protein HK405_012745 [Cladochytrium tenue]